MSLCLLVSCPSLIGCIDLHYRYTDIQCPNSRWLSGFVDDRARNFRRILVLFQHSLGILQAVMEVFSCAACSIYTIHKNIYHKSFVTFRGERMKIHNCFMLLKSLLRKVNTNTVYQIYRTTIYKLKSLCQTQRGNNIARLAQ